MQTFIAPYNVQELQRHQTIFATVQALQTHRPASAEQTATQNRHSSLVSITFPSNANVQLIMITLHLTAQGEGFHSDCVPVRQTAANAPSVAD